MPPDLPGVDTREESGPHIDREAAVTIFGMKQ